MLTRDYFHSKPPNDGPALKCEKPQQNRNILRKAKKTRKM